MKCCAQDIIYRVLVIEHCSLIVLTKAWTKVKLKFSQFATESLNDEDNAIFGGGFNCPLNLLFGFKGWHKIPQANAIRAIETRKPFSFQDIWGIKNSDQQSLVGVKNRLLRL